MRILLLAVLTACGGPGVEETAPVVSCTTPCGAVLSGSEDACAQAATAEATLVEVTAGIFPGACTTLSGVRIQVVDELPDGHGGEYYPGPRTALILRGSLFAGAYPHEMIHALDNTVEHVDWDGRGITAALTEYLWKLRTK